MASHAAGAQWGLRESNCQIVSGLMITWCPLCDQRSFCTWTILLCPLPGKVSSVRLCRRSTHQGIRRRDMRYIASPVAWLIGGNQGYYLVRSNALLETFSLWSSCCTGRDVTQLLPFPLVVQEWKAESCTPFAIPFVVLCWKRDMVLLIKWSCSLYLCRYNYRSRYTLGIPLILRHLGSLLLEESRRLVSEFLINALNTALA